MTSTPVTPSEGHGDQAPLPSFSVVMESSNLSHATLGDLYGALRTVGDQDLPVTDALQFLIIDSGDLPDEALETIRRDFPWVSVARVEPGLDYGAIKARGATLAGAEVIVLCDSDCRYEQSWLRNLLTPFAGRPDVQIVAGETAVAVKGPYGLAMALTHVFPRFSGQRSLEPALFYFANNVAIRRELLLRLPLPERLPVFRGQTIVHSLILRRAGLEIWRQPLARAVHAPPLLSDLVRRFFTAGLDSGTLGRLVGDPSGRSYLGGMEPASHRGSRARNLLQRARAVFAEDRRRYVDLPAAMPILAVAALAYSAGRVKAVLGASTQAPPFR